MEGFASKVSEPGFAEYLLKFDLCCLTETFTFANYDFTMFKDDFTVLHSPGLRLSRQGRLSGGVAIMIKKPLDTVVTALDTGCDFILALRIQDHGIDIVIICAYIPPKESPFYKDKSIVCNLVHLEDILLNFQDRFEHSTMVICGDLNSRIGVWDTNVDEENDSEDELDVLHNSGCFCEQLRSPRESQDKTVNSFGKILRNICRIHQLTVLNGRTVSDKEGKFTFVSPHGDSVIDYCLLGNCNLPYTIDLCVASRVESHHMPIEIQIGPQKAHDRKVLPYKTYTKLVWDSSKINGCLAKLESAEFDNHLRTIFNTLDTSVDLALQKLTEVLYWSADNMEREVKVGAFAPRSSSPWFDQECRKSKRSANSALKAFRKLKSPQYKATYLEARRSYKSLIREKKKQYFDETRRALLVNSRDSRVFWHLVKRSSSRYIHQADISSEKWLAHFQKMFQIPDYPQLEVDNRDVIVHGILDAMIRQEEVKQAIDNLKASKAPGLDGIPGGCLKAAGAKIIPFLTKLFNILFDAHYFPQQWTRSVIVPIHKKGNVLNPDNYRGISLLSAMSKVFTSILTKRLRSWLEHENILSLEQAGFRNQHSTVDHIYTLHAIALKNVYGEGRGKLYVAFIDYRKAFDSVCREQLWTILENVGMSTKFILMLKAMYKNVQSCVRWRHELSKFFDCSSGVKQGALESPSIFSIYIDYVADFVRKNGKHGVQLIPGMVEVFQLMFADDVVLMSTTPVGLQNQIDNLVKASKPLNLCVNLEKTKVMVFRKGGRLAKGERWYLDGKPLEVVNQYKYLGFVFSTKLSMKSAIDDNTVRGKQKGIHVLKTLWRLRSSNTSVFTKLLDSQVQPTLLYGAEVWGLMKDPSIEKAHTFVCKRFLGLGVKTPNHMVYGDLGRFPLSLSCCTRVIQYWLKLCKMSAERLPKQAYLMLLRSNVRGRLNWAEGVRDFLNVMGFGFVWLNGGVNNEKLFLKQLKQRLKDCHQQQWESRNASSSRFRWYSSIKGTLELENYLNFLNVKKFRDIFIRFRFGINDLKANTRYTNESDLCPFCEDIETETHFLIDCNEYRYLRRKYIAPYLGTGSGEIISAKLMRGKEKKIRSVAMYIYYAFEKRKQKLDFMKSSLV